MEKKKQKLSGGEEIDKWGREREETKRTSDGLQKKKKKKRTRDGDDCKLSDTVYKSTTDQSDDNSMVIRTKQMCQGIQLWPKHRT